MAIERRASVSGFTLVELIITIAIIGILAAVAIPAYTGYRLKAERSVAWADLQAMRLLQEQVFAESNTYVNCTDTANCTSTIPGFQPDASSQYVYNVEDAGTTGFTAKATRGSEVFWIREDGNRNF